MRSYEVPGCGGVLLAQRTPAHQALFAEGEEAEFFADPQECIIKARRLLADLRLCQAMGAAAHRKCHRLGWTLDARMKQLLAELPLHR
jgi:spore maturation protein CgeB